MKSTPKSCSCKQCKYSKGHKRVKALMKLEERAFRHNSKIFVSVGKDENVTPAHNGARYG